MSAWEGLTLLSPLRSHVYEMRSGNPLQEHLPEGSRQRDAVGYKPMGFGALPQAGVACLAPVTHPWLLPSPGILTHCRSSHCCPAATLHASLLSPQRSKHSSTVTGRGHGDPSLASGVPDSPALARETSSLSGNRGGQGAWGGQESRGSHRRPAVLASGLSAFKALLHCSIEPWSRCAHVALKPDVVSCIWS